MDDTDRRRLPYCAAKPGTPEFHHWEMLYRNSAGTHEAYQADRERVGAPSLGIEADKRCHVASPLGSVIVYHTRQSRPDLVDRLISAGGGPRIARLDDQGNPVGPWIPVDLDWSSIVRASFWDDSDPAVICVDDPIKPRTVSLTMTQVDPALWDLLAGPRVDPRKASKRRRDEFNRDRERRAWKTRR